MIHPVLANFSEGTNAAYRNDCQKEKALLAEIPIEIHH